MSLTAEDTPRRHPLSVDDYRRMVELGIFAPDERVELIDGTIFDMARRSDAHNVTVMHLHRALRVAEEGALISVQGLVRLSDFSQPRPDVALLRLRGDDYRAREIEAADVLLIAEVADSSLPFDRDTKMRLYAAHDIPEAWLLDVSGKRLVRHRAPQQGGYTLVDEPDLDSALEVSALPAITIDLRRLFR